MQTTLNLRHLLPAVACVSLLAAHTGDIAMLSLLFVRASKRALVTGLALALETEFAIIGLPCTADAQESSPTAAVARLSASSFDDSILASQRASRPDMAALAIAIPEISAGLLSVTLWDELARPTPAPRPVDTSGTTQFNAIGYWRK